MSFRCRGQLKNECLACHQRRSTEYRMRHRSPSMGRCVDVSDEQSRFRSGIRFLCSIIGVADRLGRGLDHLVAATFGRPHVHIGVDDIAAREAVKNDPIVNVHDRTSASDWNGIETKKAPELCDSHSRGCHSQIKKPFGTVRNRKAVIAVS